MTRVKQIHKAELSRMAQNCHEWYAFLCLNLPTYDIITIKFYEEAFTYA